MENRIQWFEIPASNFERAKHFYEYIFSIQLTVNEVESYKMGFFPPTNGGVGGAICFGEGYIPSGAGSILYLTANPDLNIVLDKVPHANGKILLTKTLIGEGLGYYAFILDTEGNRIALYSNK